MIGVIYWHCDQYFTFVTLMFNIYYCILVLITVNVILLHRNVQSGIILTTVLLVNFFNYSSELHCTVKSSAEISAVIEIPRLILLYSVF